MTKQAQFNKVYSHFILKDKPFSMNKGGSCVYRGPQGQRCAAGLFITRKEYSPYFEGSVCDVNFGNEMTPVGKLLTSKGIDITFARSLQKAHDNAAGRNDKISFQTVLKDIAQINRLTVPTK